MALILRQTKGSPLTIEEMDNNLTTAMAGGYTETIVDISSAQILAMGTTPIELLNTPGVGKYEEIQKIIIEYSGGTEYATSTALSFLGFPFPLVEGIIIKSFNIVSVLYPSVNAAVNIIGEYVSAPVTGLNEALYLTTNDGIDPTLGTGTLRVKIYHNPITFGA
jgi:hypothetical protein